MTIDRRVTVKFWRVDPLEADDMSFSEALDICSDRPESECVAEINEANLQLHVSPRDSGNRYLCDVVRLQNSGLPSLIQPGRRAARLRLREGQYLGHHTGFVFCRRTNLIGVEVRPTAVGLYRVLTLVETLAASGPFNPSPLLTRDAMEELAATKTGKLSIKIADPASLRSVDPELVSLRESLVELKEMVDGTYVNLSIGVGRRTEGLEREGLLKRIGWLLSERAAERGKIKTLKVVQPHADSPILDFIKVHVKSEETLALTEDPDADWGTRAAFLKRALANARTHAGN